MTCCYNKEVLTVFDLCMHQKVKICYQLADLVLHKLSFHDRRALSLLQRTYN